MCSSLELPELGRVGVLLGIRLGKVSADYYREAQKRLENSYRPLFSNRSCHGGRLAESR